MGVCGCGKTTVGRALADSLGWDFAEGDDYHSPGNVAKMNRGIPLTDADRRPWLEAMAADIRAWRQSGRDTVLACSALKRAYREVLAGAQRDVCFVYLRTTKAVAYKRLEARRGHYMPASLVDSQLAALEPPSPEERAIELDATCDPTESVTIIRAHLTAQETGR